MYTTPPDTVISEEDMEAFKQGWLSFGRCEPLFSSLTGEEINKIWEAIPEKERFLAMEVGLPPYVSEMFVVYLFKRLALALRPENDDSATLRIPISQVTSKAVTATLLSLRDELGISAMPQGIQTAIFTNLKNLSALHTVEEDDTTTSLR